MRNCRTDLEILNYCSAGCSDQSDVDKPVNSL